MADYIIANEFKTMEEIWDDLLRLHWNYLDTEENMEKLKMRRKLEGMGFVNELANPSNSDNKMKHNFIFFEFLLRR